MKLNMIIIKLFKKIFLNKSSMSSGGALMQLVAVGSIQHHLVPYRDIYATGIELIKSDNNILEITRNGDTCMPLYIKSDKEIRNITLSIEGQIINKFPLEFCNKIYGHETKKDNYFLYKLPWNLFSENDLYLICARHNTIKLKIESDNICNAELYIKYTFISSEPRASMAHKQHHHTIKNFRWKKYDITTGNTYLDIDLGGLIKGFFIENIDISKINSIEMLLNGQGRFRYNKTMIDLFVKKIGNDIVYIQLDDNKNTFDDFKFDSSLNMDRIETVQLKINSDIDQNIRIICLSANILQYSSGVAGLSYTFKIPDEIIKIIEKFIKKKIEGDILCLIEHTDIANGDHYMNCITCKKNYKADNLKKWFEKSKTCPHCRSKWSDYKIYINND